MKALYLHVPFCASRCSYCAFTSSVYKSQQADSYLEALAGESLSRGKSSPEELQSIYLGGGTPTVLSLKQLRCLCETIAGFATQDVSKLEMTVEANPGSADAQRLALLREFGFRRISIGAQSFQDHELKLLGRRHQPRDVKIAVENARSAGFQSINLDLIFGLPAQTTADFMSNLSQALKLEPEHISIYGLSYEPGTPLTGDLQAGRVTAATQELERQTYLQTVACLTDHGFEHYEISNFARPGQQCRHNITYWNGGDYLGLGAGACSYLDGQRLENQHDIPEYCSAIASSGDAIISREKLNPEKAAREALMLGLRQTRGISLQEFARRTGFAAPELFGEALAIHRDAGRIEISADRLRLTLEGLLVANSVMSDFI
jgi:oxygen-independent coproporphyrinogen III oxidase